MSMEGGFGCSGHRLWQPGAGRQRGFGQAVRRSSGHLPPNNVVLRRRPRRRSRTVQRRVSDAFCGLETGRLKGIWQAVRQSSGYLYLDSAAQEKHGLFLSRYDWKARRGIAYRRWMRHNDGEKQ